MKRAQEGSSSSSPPGTEVRHEKIARSKSGLRAGNLVAPPRKMFRCTVHDSIYLEALLVQIVDTRYFQRLRNLKQLGTTPYVYPCANHERFDHSLGVAHLAEQLCRSIAAHPMPTGVEKPTEHDILCVKIAALCHDLGHGPYSHVFDSYLADKGHKHEDLSVRLIRRLIEEHEIKLGDNHETDLRFIEELIMGDDLEGERWGRGYSKSYLYDVVSNADSGLDVDKLDYLQRDPQMTGNAAPQFVITRLLENAQVRVALFDGEPKERPCICFATKVKKDVLGVFRTRFIMHEETYTHKVAKGFELLLVDYLTAADALGHLYCKGGRKLKLGETARPGNEEAFLKMTDASVLFYYDQLLNACDDEWASKPESSAESAERRELARVRRLQQRVDARLPYRCIGDCEWADGTSTEKNPMDNVRFYEKGDGPDDLATQQHDTHFDDANLPRAFESKRFRAFFKDERSSPKYEAAVQAVAQLGGWRNVPRLISDCADEFEDVGAMSQEPPS